MSRTPSRPRDRTHRTSRPSRDRAEEPEVTVRTHVPAPPMPSITRRQWTPFKWRPYASTGISLLLDVHSTVTRRRRFYLRGEGKIPAEWNSEVDEKASSIIFNKYYWLSVQVPSKLRRCLEECLGRSWRRQVVRKVLAIHCLGHSYPAGVDDMERGTGGHYLFSLSVYDKNAALIAETTKRQEA